MKGAVDKAEELARTDPKYFLARQFDNPANPAVHRRTTALEVLEQVPELDAFVAGIGTGGTVTGVGEILARKKPGTLVVAVEPEILAPAHQGHGRAQQDPGHRRQLRALHPQPRSLQPGGGRLLRRRHQLRPAC